MRDPWSFYDGLIAGVPEGIAVKKCCLGKDWCYVDAECGMGVAYMQSGGLPRTYADDMRKLSLKELAALSKSWNYPEASIGVAALNAWYSQPERIDAMGAIYDPQGRKEDGKPRKDSVFTIYHDIVENGKVTVIGHFPHIEKTSELAASLIVLERNCSSDIDTPDPACEYVLPSQDFVFCTGVTIINKTAPRIFTLCEKPFLVMSGPSVVPAPDLFDWNVDCIAGSTVYDPEASAWLIDQSAGMPFGRGMKTFRIEKKS